MPAPPQNLSVDPAEDDATPGQAQIAATYSIETDHVEVVAFAQQTCAGARDDREKATRLFYAVRDQIRYDPYVATLVLDDYRASITLSRKRAFCIPKAILLAAAARAVGIPARLRFADVRNHLASDRLIELMRSEVFAFHGYNELWLGGRWVKATATFDAKLCRHFGVKCLEFDGHHDAVLHPYDEKGRQHMEYLEDHGAFDDLPFQRMVASWKHHYPHFITGVGQVELITRR